MKLLTELIEEVDFISEQKGGEKHYFIKGPFMAADMKNKNGRIYPKAVLEQAVNNFMTLVKENRALGELGHPATPNINYDRTSHLITDLGFDGNYVYGKAKVLSTPMGNIVKTFLDEGVKIGVSSRGLGSLKPSKSGLMEVQNDYRIATVDIVHDPSGPNCFVEGLMENAEWVFGPSGWQQQIAENCKKMVNKKVKQKKFNEQAALRLMDHYMKLLSNH